MSQRFPRICLARHGETPWSLSGQHTGRTDILLTERGEHDAISLGNFLKKMTVDAVFTSPLLRARRTCELAGFGAPAQNDPDLMEWDYGAYEGQTREWIVEKRPDWYVFRDGCPDGETPEDVRKRADRVVARVRALGGNVLLFSHGHFLRVLATSWLGVPIINARLWMFTTASISILGYDHNLNEPAIHLWNNDGQLVT